MGTTENTANNGQAGRELEILEDYMIKDSYGAEVRAHPSSSARAPHYWVGVEGGGIAESGGTNNGSAHLNVEQARWLRDKLSAWIDEAEKDYAKSESAESMGKR